MLSTGKARKALPPLTCTLVNAINLGGRTHASSLAGLISGYDLADRHRRDTAVRRVDVELTGARAG